MCQQCDGFTETIRIDSPYQCRDILRQVKEAVEQGSLRWVKGSPGLGAWDDVILHEFECPNCGRGFRLFVETYHGSGGAWTVKE